MSTVEIDCHSASKFLPFRVVDNLNGGFCRQTFHGTGSEADEEDSRQFHRPTERSSVRASESVLWPGRSKRVTVGIRRPDVFAGQAYRSPMINHCCRSSG
jgi:hypothetical protein